MTLTYHHPETRLPRTDLDHFDRLFGDLFGRPEENRNWTPAIDVQENEDGYALRAEVPGVDSDSLDISVEDGVLTLTGEKKDESEEKTDKYYHRERRFGRFERSFSLPELVDTDNIQADFRHGILTVTLPKKEAAKPRRIEVRS